MKVSSTDTLVTKTMLGVFGCVPALDRYFRIGFREGTRTKPTLKAIGSTTGTTRPRSMLRRHGHSRWTSAPDSRVAAVTPEAKIQLTWCSFSRVSTPS